MEQCIDSFLNGEKGRKMCVYWIPALHQRHSAAGKQEATGRLPLWESSQSLGLGSFLCSSGRCFDIVYVTKLQLYLPEGLE